MNIPYKTLIMAAIVVSAIAFFGLWQYERLDHSKTKDDLEAANTNIENMTNQKGIDDAKSEKLQKGLAATNNRNADLKRMLGETRCIEVSQTARGSDATPPNSGLSNDNGIDAYALVDFATECERVGKTLDALQEWNNETYSNYN